MPSTHSCPPLVRLLINPEVRPVWGSDDEAALLDAYERVWRRKASLREAYESWYERIASELAPGTIVEVGAGTGNFKRWLSGRRTWTLDILRGRWVDVQADALALPFADGSLDNLVLIDALHHFARPVEFLRSAARALRPDGRVLLIEPYVSLWGRFVYRYLHHERVDFNLDKPTSQAWDGNAAIPRVVLQASALRQTGLTLARVEHLEFLSYPLSGGFSYRAMLPAPVLAVLRRAERLPVLRNRFLALRIFAVLRRQPVR